MQPARIKRMKRGAAKRWKLPLVLGDGEGGREIEVMRAPCGHRRLRL